MKRITITYSPRRAFGGEPGDLFSDLVNTFNNGDIRARITERDLRRAPASRHPRTAAVKKLMQARAKRRAA